MDLLDMIIWHETTDPYAELEDLEEDYEDEEE